MNKVRKKYIVTTANEAMETLNRGSHSTISRERIAELVNIIAELFQEIDDLEKKKCKI
jgi:hypothetical protein